MFLRNNIHGSQLSNVFPIKINQIALSLGNCELRINNNYLCFNTHILIYVSKDDKMKLYRSFGDKYACSPLNFFLVWSPCLLWWAIFLQVQQNLTK